MPWIWWASMKHGFLRVVLDWLPGHVRILGTKLGATTVTTERGCTASSASVWSPAPMTCCLCFFIFCRVPTISSRSTGATICWGLAGSLHATYPAREQTGHPHFLCAATTPSTHTHTHGQIAFAVVLPHVGGVAVPVVHNAAPHPGTQHGLTSGLARSLSRSLCNGHPVAHLELLP